LLPTPSLAHGAVPVVAAAAAGDQPSSVYESDVQSAAAVEAMRQKAVEDEIARQRQWSPDSVRERTKRITDATLRFLDLDVTPV
jgi:hypothetical protein